MDFISDKLAGDLAEIMVRDGDVPLPVIVQLNEDLSEACESIITEVGGKVNRKLNIINSYSTELSVDSIKSLINNPRVKKIYYDGEISIV